MPAVRMDETPRHAKRGRQASLSVAGDGERGSQTNFAVRS